MQLHALRDFDVEQAVQCLHKYKSAIFFNFVGLRNSNSSNNNCYRTVGGCFILDLNELRLD